MTKPCGASLSGTHGAREAAIPLPRETAEHIYRASNCEWQEKSKRRQAKSAFEHRKTYARVSQSNRTPLFVPPYRWSPTSRALAHPTYWLQPSDAKGTSFSSPRER